MINIARGIRGCQCMGERSWNLYFLNRQKNRIADSITHAIRATLKRRLTKEEANWINRIEHLRAELKASTQQITRTDYGAGNPGSNRTQAQMQRGVEVTDKLGSICQTLSKPPFWCLLLFMLIRAVRPVSCIEIGTAVGISAAYQGAALRLNEHGGLVTLEGAATTRRNCS